MTNSQTPITHTHRPVGQELRWEYTEVPSFDRHDRLLVGSILCSILLPLLVGGRGEGRGDGRGEDEVLFGGLGCVCVFMGFGFDRKRLPLYLSCLFEQSMAGQRVNSGIGAGAVSVSWTGFAVANDSGLFSYFLIFDGTDKGNVGRGFLYYYYYYY